jgi:O-antigen ligase
MAHLLKSIKVLLFITAFTPLIVLSNLPFPFVLGKILFFRSIVEIALALFLAYLIIRVFKEDSLKSEIGNWKFLKSPLFIFLALLLISLIISTVFAVNPYRAFWGDLERGEGLFGFLHFFAFLIMSIAVFDKRDWLRFFKISLAIGFISVFYAFLQYFHIQKFPFLLNPNESRPLSFIGNPAFLATHMFFVAMFAIIVFYQHKSVGANINQRPNAFWGYFSLLTVVLSAATIFITATRGAILGLAAAVFFLLLCFIFQKQSVILRKISAIIFCFLIVFSGIFWFTRSASLWQTVPGLNRLAKTAVFNINDYSTQFRLMTWQLSLKAAKEKPIFGWGPENYLMAYEKHYNPNYAAYGESWMDRAHNKIFDIVVMQGFGGLLAYFGIFISAFFSLRRLNTSSQQQVYFGVFIGAGLIGYFVQNLFVMDQIISDVMFFSIIGFILAQTPLYKELVSISSNPEAAKRYSKKILAISLSTIAIVSLGYIFYFYNYIPYVQAKTIGEAKIIERASAIEAKLKQATRPYNFSQFNLRAYIVDYYYNDQPQIFNNASFTPLSDFFVNLIEEIIQKEPYDIRMFIRKTQMLQSKAINDPQLYKEAERSIRKAIEIAPNRQELYYNLSFNLLGQERFQGAIGAVRKSIEMSPNVARSHYHLAFVLAVIGPENEKEIIKEMEVADKLSPNFKGLQPGDQNIIALVYSRLGYSDKVAELVKRSIDMQLSIRFLPTYYEEALGYYAFLRDADNFIKLAKDASNFYPSLKDDMEVLIDLAKKGNWEIIGKLAK